MATEITVDGREYRIGKLDAMKQFHVSRRIAPIVPTLVPIFLKLTAQGGKPLTSDLSGLAEVLGPFADGLAEMSDETSEYVIGTCLSIVHRRDGDSWAPVWNTRGGGLMFDDIELGSMLPLVVRVVQDSLGPFISGILTSQKQDSTAKA